MNRWVRRDILKSRRLPIFGIPDNRYPPPRRLHRDISTKFQSSEHTRGMLMTGNLNDARQQTRELSHNINWLEIHLPKWPQLASRPTCWHVLPIEALVGTHRCTSHRQSDLQLFPFQNQLRLYLAYTRPCPVDRGEARVNNAFSILRIYVWVRTVARHLGLNSPLLLVSWNSGTSYYCRESWLWIYRVCMICSYQT